MGILTMFQSSLPQEEGTLACDLLGLLHCQAGLLYLNGVWNCK